MRGEPPRDPVWRDARVLSVVRRHVPTARAVTGFDDAGRYARLYFVDDAMLLKVARRSRYKGAASLLREAIWLARAPAGALVPRVLGSGTAYGSEYGLQAIVHGVPLQGSTTLVGWPKTAALAQVGATLALLHRTRLSAQELALFPTVTMEKIREQSLLELEDLLAVCPEIDGRHVRRKLMEAWATRPADAPEVIVHGALSTRNVLVDPVNGGLAALVDLAEAKRGPAALDLATFWPTGTRKIVLDGYRTVAELPPGLDALSGALGILAALRKHRAHNEGKADTIRRRLPG